MSDKGAVIASVCSGAVLLAEAGLLDGCEAITHWGYCPVLRREYHVTLRESRTLVAAGPEHRVVTSGGV